MDALKRVLTALDNQRANVSAILAALAVLAPSLGLTEVKQTQVVALVFAGLAIGLAVADAIETHAPTKSA